MLFVLENVGKSSAAFRFRLISQRRWLPANNTERCTFNDNMYHVGKECLRVIW